MNAPVSEAALAPEASQVRMLLVRAMRMEAQGIFSYELVDPQGQALPEVTAGAHGCAFAGWAGSVLLPGG